MESYIFFLKFRPSKPLLKLKKPFLKTSATDVFQGRLPLQLHLSIVSHGALALPKWRLAGPDGRRDSFFFFACVCFFLFGVLCCCCFWFWCVFLFLFVISLFVCVFCQQTQVDCWCLMGIWHGVVLLGQPQPLRPLTLQSELHPPERQRKRSTSSRLRHKKPVSYIGIWWFPFFLYIVYFSMTTYASLF